MATRLPLVLDSSGNIAELPSADALNVPADGSTLAGLTIANASNATVALNINVPGTQSANILSIHALVGTYLTVSSSGVLFVNVDGASLSATKIKAVSNSTVGLTVDCVAFSSADLQEWKQNGLLKASMSTAGLLNVTGLTVTGSVQGNITFAADILSQGNITSNGTISFTGTESHSGTENHGGQVNLNGNVLVNGALSLANTTTTHGVGDSKTVLLGSNYTGTASMANIGLSITLPVVGTYLIVAQIRTYASINVSSGASAYLQAQVVNTTLGVGVCPDTLIDYSDNQGTANYFGHQQTTSLLGITTTTTTNQVVNIQAQTQLGGASSGGISVLTNGTQIMYVRIA